MIFDTVTVLVLVFNTFYIGPAQSCGQTPGKPDDTGVGAKRVQIPSEETLRALGP